MSIIAYTGLPGHGKSYGVVENVIIKALISKRVVFTNIPMLSDICMSRYGFSVTQFTIDDLLINDDWFTDVFLPGSIFVLDEAWRLWPAGLKTNLVKIQHKTFLAEHRHLVGANGRSTEIAIVTQDLAQISNFARSLIETTFKVVKLSKVGLSKKFRTDVYFGAVTGVSPPVSKRENEIFGTFKKSTFELYQSHTKSDSGLAGDETRTDDRFNILKSLKVKLFFVVFFVVSLFVYFGLSSLFSHGLSSSKISTSVTPSVSPVVVTLSDLKKLNLEKNRLAASLLLIQQKKELLYSAKYISIVFNNGHFPKIDFIFRVFFDDTNVDFSPQLLLSQGYKFLPLSNCLVHIYNDHYSVFAKCYPQKQKTDFFNTLTS